MQERFNHWTLYLMNFEFFMYYSFVTLCILMCVDLCILKGLGLALCIKSAFSISFSHSCTCQCGKTCIVIYLHCDNMDSARIVYCLFHLHRFLNLKPCIDYLIVDVEYMFTYGMKLPNSFQYYCVCCCFLRL